MAITRGKVRMLLAMCAALSLLVLAACGDDDDSADSGDSGGGGGGKIALLLPETKTTRYEEQDKPNFERHVKELCPDCEVIYSNANQDPAKQQQQAEAAITNGAKVIVISAVDVKSAAGIVARAKQSDVKVIAYGRLIPDADIDYYVSIDPFKVGEQQAEVQMKAVKAQNPNVVMINGAPTDSNAKPYKDGATKVLKEQGAKIVKSFDTPDWSPDKAQQEMESSITDLGNNGFDAVYVANDGMAGGAIAALKGGRIDSVIAVRDRAGRRARGNPAHPHRRPADDRLPAPHPDRRVGGRDGGADRAGRGARRRAWPRTRWTTARRKCRRSCSTRSPSPRTTSRARWSRTAS